MAEGGKERRKEKRRRANWRKGNRKTNIRKIWFGTVPFRTFFYFACDNLASSFQPPLQRGELVWINSHMNHQSHLLCEGGSFHLCSFLTAKLSPGEVRSDKPKCAFLVSPDSISLCGFRSFLYWYFTFTTLRWCVVNQQQGHIKSYGY